MTNSSEVCCHTCSERWIIFVSLLGVLVSHWQRLDSDLLL